MISRFKFHRRASPGAVAQRFHSLLPHSTLRPTTIFAGRSNRETCKIHPCEPESMLDYCTSEVPRAVRSGVPEDNFSPELHFNLTSTFPHHTSISVLRFIPSASSVSGSASSNYARVISRMFTPPCRLLLAPGCNSRIDDQH